MTLAYWCVFIAGILPYLAAVYAKMAAGGSGYDNHAPRASLEQLEDKRRRSNWAQLNGFEAFPFFAAAVIIAHQLHASQLVVDVLASLFIALRLLYWYLYVADHSTIRSMVWTLGFMCVIAIFIVATF